MSVKRNIQPLARITFPMPPHTCGIIDTTIADLEKVRTANEQLRAAAHNYEQRNDELLAEMKLITEEIRYVLEENVRLRASLRSSTLPDELKSKLLQLKELDRLQRIEYILFEVLEAGRVHFTNSFNFNKRLSSTAQAFIKATEPTRKKLFNDRRKEAIAKLSEADIALLNIKLPAEDDDDEAEG